MHRALAQPLALALTLSGCAAVQSVLETAEKPTADMVRAHLVSIGLDRSTVAFDVEIHNPYEVDLPLLDVRYGLASEGEHFLTGEADLSGVIPAGGDKTVTIPATVVYRDLLGMLDQIQPGHVVPYVAELAVAVDAPGGLRFEIPLNRTGELPIPAIPKIDVTRIDWGEISLSGATGTLHLTLENTNQFPLEIEGLDYSLSIGGHALATTHVDRRLSLARSGRGAMAIEIDIPAKSLAAGLIGLLRDERVEYGLAGALAVATPYGTMTMPLDQSGRTMVATEVSQ